jgi:hypothetical protein
LQDLHLGLAFRTSDLVTIYDYQIRYQWKNPKKKLCLATQNRSFAKSSLRNWPVLAAAAGVAAVETFVAGACADHYHAAVVTGGRV